ncbi:MAG: ubiquinone/menaquinone biosynthesis methyltransferase [Candidatus Desulforudis sp.]|nr:ubiquinone/menaquinone biosynthesis methyltransferase [Desulforudis sp.]
MRFGDNRQEEEFVRSLFASLARRYDLLNSVLSLNRTRYWRRFAVSKCDLKPGDTALDVACGTGLLTFELARAVGPKGRVVGIDFCTEMLEQAEKNRKRTAFRDVVRFEEGRATELPFPNDTFNCAVMGFALHAMPDTKKAVLEMIRVVKPGGKVVNLDLARPGVPVLKQVHSLYVNRMMPLLGRSFNYFSGSLNRLPHQSEIRDLFSRLGLTETQCFDLTGGIAAVQVGIKTPKA